jgi:O-antigen/teichoic acid export membrane protein
MTYVHVNLAESQALCTYSSNKSISNLIRSWCLHPYFSVNISTFLISVIMTLYNVNLKAALFLASWSWKITRTLSVHAITTFIVTTALHVENSLHYATCSVCTPLYKLASRHWKLKPPITAVNISACRVKEFFAVVSFLNHQICDG